MTKDILRYNSSPQSEKNKYINSEKWYLVGYFSEKRDGTFGLCLPTYKIINNDLLFGGELATKLQELINRNGSLIHIFRDGELEIKTELGEKYYSKYDTYEIFVDETLLDPICQMIKETTGKFNLNKCKEL